MRFNKLTLTNIGAYHNSHEFDLTTENKNRNVILFGGENGAGKTTILDSIRLALFGPFAYGYRTENDTYFSKIRTILNNTATNNGERFYQIKLEFEYVDNFEKHNYTFTRKWNYDRTTKKIKESVNIYRDEQYLDEFDSEVFFSKIKEEMPPHLFDFLLFDGEEISRVISDDKLSDYLKEISKVMLNLDLMKNLEEDLKNFIKMNQDSNSNSQDENEILKIDEEIDKLIHSKGQLESYTDKIKTKIQFHQEELNTLKNDFSLYGGLIKEERDQLKNKQNEIEQIRKGKQEELKSFILDLFPIFLVKDLVYDVRSQMEKEQENEVYNYLSNKITPENLESIINKLTNNLVDNTNESLIEKILIDGLLEKFKPINGILIHQASFQQRSEIESILKRLNSIDVSDKINLFTENQKLLLKIQKIKKQIEKNDSTHDFKELLEKIELLSKEIELLKLELSEKEKEIVLVKESLEIKEKEKNKLTIKVLNSNKIDNVFAVSTKIISLSKEFGSIQLKKKLQAIEFDARNMFNKLLRKEEYISYININPETFEISLFTPANEIVNMKSLSAGEKQILLLSIIWAIVKTSGRKFPFVYDTLLGRLDKIHKKNILTKLIPLSGEQVIILATDSEIDDAHFQYIEPLISKSYTIDFKKSENKVTVFKNQFFKIPIDRGLIKNEQ